MSEKLDDRIPRAAWVQGVETKGGTNAQLKQILGAVTAFWDHIFSVEE